MARKRLLVLAPRVPFPTIGGDRLRLVQIARALAQDFDLTLLAMTDDPRAANMQASPQTGLFASIELVYLPKWQSYLNTLVALASDTPLQLAYYRSEEFRRRVLTLAPQHDGVVAHLIRTGQYAESLESQKVLFEMTDAISLNYGRARLGSSDWRNIVYALEQKRLKTYEQDVPAKFSETWLVSEVDARYLFGERVPDSVTCVPVGVDLSEFPFQIDRAGNTIAFIGNMLSAQNRDACCWFVRSIFPRIARRVPGIRLRMIGSLSQKDRDFYQRQPGIEATGHVEKIADSVGAAFCGVCPVRFGAGMQNKILNYMALGLPCVTTRIGLEGIDAEIGRDLLTFDTEEQAAQHIVRLHSDAALRKNLAENGRRLVERVYDWKIIQEQMRRQARQLFG